MMPIGGSDTDRPPSLHLILQLTRIEISGSMKHPDVISSPDSKRAEHAAKLLKRRDRRLTGQFLVEGAQGVREALDSTGAIVELFITEEAAEAHPEFVAEAKAAGTPWNIAAAEVDTEL